MAIVKRLVVAGIVSLCACGISFAQQPSQSEPTQKTASPPQRQPETPKPAPTISAEEIAKLKAEQLDAARDSREMRMVLANEAMAHAGRDQATASQWGVAGLVVTVLLTLGAFVAAWRSAEAAKEANRKGLRAWVSAKDYKLLPNRSRDGFVISFDVPNNGPTPAFDLELFAIIAVVDDKAKVDQLVPIETNEPKTVVRAGGATEFERPFDVSDADLTDIEARQKWVGCKVRINYVDIYKNACFLEFGMISERKSDGTYEMHAFGHDKAG